MEPAPSFAHRASPGNGTRYDLVYVTRSGGGWAVVWEPAGLVARLRSTRTDTGPAFALEPVGTGWSPADLQAVASITNAPPVAAALGGAGVSPKA